MVTGENNNNKFYTMVYEGGNEFEVEYGRVEQSCTKLKYPINEWDKIYKSKIKKGYKDVSELVAVTITEQKNNSKKELKEILDLKVRNFINLMRKYTDNLVTETYSVKADKVSQKQIDDAQALINDINDLIKIDKHLRDNDAINIKLIDLYTVIPRRIKNVKFEILPHIDIDKVIQAEQDNLDAMASQVVTLKEETEEVKEEQVIEEKTYLDTLGISMREATSIELTEINHITSQLKGYKIDKIFKVDKPYENKRFEDWLNKCTDKSTRLLIHGTRCTSVIPILQVGLKIRPAGNFQFSGKAYGEGNYFSEVASKSLNYVGRDSDRILLVYEVHTGNPFIYEGWYRGNSFSLNYNELSKRGYDSTYVKAGHGLLNTEIIAYHEHQNRIKYIIHLH